MHAIRLLDASTPKGDNYTYLRFLILQLRILIALYWLEHYVCCLSLKDQMPISQTIKDLIGKIPEVKKG